MLTLSYYNLNHGAEASLMKETESKLDRTSDEQFRSFGRFDPFEAKRVLARLEQTDIRFKIYPESIIVPSKTRRWRYNSIEIFIHEDDLQRANTILPPSLFTRPDRTS
jgi:hypothetical protein